MPSVGCEATVSFQEDITTVDSSSQDLLATAADGSYALVPLCIPPDSKETRLEHCFVLGTQAARVKVVQKLIRDRSTGGWKVNAVEVHKEK
jgi:hypothetical protein